MENLDLQVGDRITYEYTNSRKRFIEIANSDNVSLSSVCWFERHLKNKQIEILRIERVGLNGWRTVYKKKNC